MPIHTLHTFLRKYFSRASLISFRGYPLPIYLSYPHFLRKEIPKFFHRRRTPNGDEQREREREREN